MQQLVDALASYLPALVLRRLVERRLPLGEPRAERFPAAVLFADIAGSTALAERLAEHGPVGAEELSRLLNTYLGELIEMITAYGGDVSQFAGDALLALWPVTSAEDDLAGMTRVAAQCGLAVQAALGDQPTPVETRLSLRIGIAAGEVSLVYVGGAAGACEFLFVGAPILQASTAEKLAAPGDVALSPQAWALVQGDCTGDRLDSGNMRLRLVRVRSSLRPPDTTPLRAELEGPLRAIVPEPVLSRLVAGQTEWLAELRQITVLFINLPDLDYEAQLAEAQAATRVIQTTLKHYESTLTRLGMDDKGLTVLAAFGLAPRAHEDDAARAVQAAQAIHRSLHDLRVRCAVGISTGRAFCGSIGNQRRREYTLVGDVVNLAARLMQATVDDMLCNAATVRAASRYLSFEALPAIVVRGKAEPVAVYRPRGPVQKAVRTHVALIGRTTERACLADQLQTAVRTTSSAVVIIEGEAGIGKSCLVDDLRKHAQEMCVTVLVGAGDAIETATPYQAWRAIFSTLFQLGLLRESLEARRAHVLSRIASSPRAPDWPAVEGLVPLLNAVLPLVFPENDLTASMTARARADNTNELLVQILQRAAAAAPLLLVFEDAHWLDSASWALMRLVSQRVRPALLIIVTRRPLSRCPRNTRQLLHAPGTQRLRLDALGPDETVAPSVPASRCHQSAGPGGGAHSRESGGEPALQRRTGPCPL